MVIFFCKNNAFIGNNKMNLIECLIFIINRYV